MKNFLHDLWRSAKFLAILALIFFVLIVVIVSGWIIGYRTTSSPSCADAAVEINDLNDKLNEFNKTDVPFQELYLTPAEFRYLLQESLNRQVCVNLGTGRFTIETIGGVLVIDSEIRAISQEPYLKITQIDISGLKMPTLIKESYNDSLNDAWQDYFDSQFSGRQITGIEIYTDQVVIQGEVE